MSNTQRQDTESRLSGQGSDYKNHTMREQNKGKSASANEEAHPSPKKPMKEPQEEPESKRVNAL